MNFPDCGKNPLGLYPIVDDATWLEKLLPLGVTTIQLRIKNQPISQIANQIARSVTLANAFGARLFINDHWQLAIQHRAYGIHLGQSDLAIADLKQIHDAGLRLGISTHTCAEFSHALSLHPSYLACGPIYFTTSKSVATPPIGISQLTAYCQFSPYPIVAIGGITLERLPFVLNGGANGIAMIAGITQADDPLAMTRALLALI